MKRPRMETVKRGENRNGSSAPRGQVKRIAKRRSRSTQKILLRGPGGCRRRTEADGGHRVTDKNGFGAVGIVTAWSERVWELAGDKCRQ